MSATPSTAYVFMSDKTVNPADGKGNDYYTVGGEQILYVVRRAGAKALKAVTSYGRATGWTVGAHVPIIADQSGRYLGYHQVVGIVFEDGTTAGEVPNKSLRHGVFK